jgi:hypothetical protein
MRAGCIESVVLGSGIHMLLVGNGVFLQSTGSGKPGVSNELLSLLDVRFPWFLERWSAICLSDQFLDYFLMTCGGDT